MPFWLAVKTCFRKFAVFSGRASRSEYWWFALFCFLASLLVSTLIQSIWGSSIVRTETGGHITNPGERAWDILGLILFIPGLAVGWRRFHDVGRPGWNILFPVIPFLAIMVGAIVVAGRLSGFDTASEPAKVILEMHGRVGGLMGFLLALWLTTIVTGIWVLYWLVQPSQPGDNKYGPSPVGNS